jgi:S-DNA-T family DNA segregation ATPase FtsK/SpoIIIE
VQHPVFISPALLEPNFKALPIGVQEDGRTWLLNLLDTHVLIGEATNAGKGSGALVNRHALTGGIRQGTVQIWAIDPKGCMELTYRGGGCPARLPHQRRHADLARGRHRIDAEPAGLPARQNPRPHPTATDPLVVILVDELGALIAYTDRDTKRRANEYLQLQLSQGRAVGIVVVAALPDPSKEVLPFRELFPARIALRLILGRPGRDDPQQGCPH